MLIDEFRGRLPVRRMCELLKVSKTAYYNWFFKIPAAKGKTLGAGEEIAEIVTQFSGYGYRRVTAELKRRGRRINHKRVLSIMRAKHLIKRRKRRFIKTTDSDHGLPVFPNLIRRFIPAGVNQLWVADITYIRLRREFVYLAVILDAFSRRIVGWNLRGSLDRELSLSALRMALVKRDIGPGLIHHSDRGIQYACREYIDLLKSSGISISMSRAGNPYDNAKAESFMATLKKEEVHLFEYDDLFEARSRIGSFIEDVYNEKRLHSALGYLPPAEFEGKFLTVEWA